MTDTNSEINAALNSENAPMQPAIDSVQGAMVTPKNQVVLEPQQVAVSNAARLQTTETESVQQMPSVQPEQPAQAPIAGPAAREVSDSMPAEMAWPDAQPAEITESAPNQSAATESGSKFGLIIGLLVMLGLAVGAYIALRAF